mgnify:CR=1 FL=1
MCENAPKVGTLELADDAEYGDIQSMVEAIAKSPGLKIESNEDGTYDIFATYK